MSVRTLSIFDRDKPRYARVGLVLAAGAGSRLGGRFGVPKPLVDVGGLSLIERVIFGLSRAGVERFVVVVGAQAAQVMRGVRALPRLRSSRIDFVVCDDHVLGNGHSLAAGAGVLAEPFLLSMSDHVFDPRIALRLQACVAEDPDRAHLATDGRLAEVFDLDDATKVRVEGAAIREIGKDLRRFSRIDAGLFACPAWTGAEAAQAIANGGHSVSDIMRWFIARGALLSSPVEPFVWQDVDTPEMLAEAQRRLTASADDRGHNAEPDDDWHSGFLRAVARAFGATP